jgi:putative ABC transport system permease protein
VRKSVRSEALLLGFLSSVLGYLLGIVLFTLLTRFVAQFRDIAGTVTMRITPFSVLAVLLIGVAVTFLSAFVPAWRASRTRPVEALRSVAVDRSGSNRVLAVIGLACLALGALILIIGSLTSQFLLMVFGPPLLFLGVLVGGPVLAAAFGRLVQLILGPFGKGTLKVGVENVQRNPRRSAATALALVIGVFLVVLVTAGGGAVRDYAVGQLSEFGGSDLTVIAFSGEMPDDYVRQVRAVEGVAAVAEVYPNVGESAEGFPLSAVDYKEVAGLGLAFDQGDPAKLGPDDVILPSFLTQQGRLKVGDPIVVSFNNGEQRRLRLGGISKPAFPPSAYLSLDTARQVDPAIVPVLLQVTAQPGKVKAVTDSVTGISRQYAGIDVAAGNFFAQTIKNFFNFVITAANGLLTVAVVIALFGIVNTLVLSVTERTREIGLLRAVGMTRRQVRATIRLESISVSLLGALVGTTFGLFVAWSLTRPILNQDGEVSTGFSWPLSQLLVIAVLSLLVGVGAAIVPARRAARLNIIEAVTVD